jgi:hypothetical protein
MIKRCLVCGREFETFDKARRGRSLISKKLGVNRVTCSLTCKKIYSRYRKRILKKTIKLKPIINEYKQKYSPITLRMP